MPSLKMGLSLSSTPNLLSQRIDNEHSLFCAELPQKPTHRIVEVVNHSLLQRDDRVVRNVNILRANLGAAFGDIAESDAQIVLQQFSPRHAIERMHLQPGDANEETRAAELLLLLVIAQHVADVLAEETFNALAKLLNPIDVALIHLPFNVRARCEGRNPLVDFVIPGDIRN